MKCPCFEKDDIDDSISIIRNYFSRNTHSGKFYEN